MLQLLCSFLSRFVPGIQLQQFNWVLIFSQIHISMTMCHDSTFVLCWSCHGYQIAIFESILYTVNRYHCMSGLLLHQLYKQSLNFWWMHAYTEDDVWLLPFINFHSCHGNKIAICLCILPDVISCLGYNSFPYSLVILMDTLMHRKWCVATHSFPFPQFTRIFTLSVLYKWVEFHGQAIPPTVFKSFNIC